MTTARVQPMAARLSDGRVLLVGTIWTDNTRDTRSSDIFDPAANAWTAGPSLPADRTDAVLVALDDGRALIAGGLNSASQSYSSAYVLDPSAGSWTKVGLMGVARTRASAALLGDGRVLVAGGYFSKGGSAQDGTGLMAAFRVPAAGSGPAWADVAPDHIGPAMATAELFDPASGTWSMTGSMAYARFGASMATLSDGRVLVVGTESAQCCGVDVSGRAYDSAELYDPATGKWSSAGTLPAIDRTGLQQQGPSGANKIPPSAPEPDGSAQLIALPDGGALLVNDHRSWKHAGEIDRSFRFDAATRTWSLVGQTYIEVGEPGAVELVIPGTTNLGSWQLAALPDGSLFGLWSDTGDVARIDPISGAVTPLAKPAVTRTLPAVVTLADGSVLVAGGDDPDGNNLATADRYVP